MKKWKMLWCWIFTLMLLVSCAGTDHSRNFYFDVCGDNVDLEILLELVKSGNEESRADNNTEAKLDATVLP